MNVQNHESVKFTQEKSDDNLPIEKNGDEEILEKIYNSFNVLDARVYGTPDTFHGKVYCLNHEINVLGLINLSELTVFIENILWFSYII